MSQTIRITSTPDVPLGEITRFEVTARCPHCEEDTSITQSEMNALLAQCQHCDEEFRLYLD